MRVTKSIIFVFMLRWAAFLTAIIDISKLSTSANFLPLNSTLIAGVEKRNVAIFDDFISSNNTDEDFDEITATLGDVDAYIEHQRTLQSGI